MTQSDSPPDQLSVADIRCQIAAEWLKIAQWSQRRAYRKPHRFLALYCIYNIHVCLSRYMLSPVRPAVCLSVTRMDQSKRCPIPLVFAG